MECINFVRKSYNEFFHSEYTLFSVHGKWESINHEASAVTNGFYIRRLKSNN